MRPGALGAVDCRSGWVLLCECTSSRRLYCTGLAQIPVQQRPAVKHRRKKPTESSIFSPLFVTVCILLFTLMLCWTFCLFGRPSCSPTQESWRRCCVCHSEKNHPMTFSPQHHLFHTRQLIGSWPCSGRGLIPAGSSFHPIPKLQRSTNIIPVARFSGEEG